MSSNRVCQVATAAAAAVGSTTPASSGAVPERIEHKAIIEGVADGRLESEGSLGQRRRGLPENLLLGFIAQEGSRVEEVPGRRVHRDEDRGRFSHVGADVRQDRFEPGQGDLELSRRRDETVLLKGGLLSRGSEKVDRDDGQSQECDRKNRDHRHREAAFAELGTSDDMGFPTGQVDVGDELAATLGRWDRCGLSRIGSWHRAHRHDDLVGRIKKAETLQDGNLQKMLAGCGTLLDKFHGGTGSGAHRLTAMGRGSRGRNTRKSGCVLRPHRPGWGLRTFDVAAFVGAKLERLEVDEVAQSLFGLGPPLPAGGGDASQRFAAGSGDLFEQRRC